MTRSKLAILYGMRSYVWLTLRSKADGWSQTELDMKFSRQVLA